MNAATVQRPKTRSSCGQQNIRGFTLIELMIAVVIIGILATFAVPSYHEFRRHSHLAAINSDFRNFGTSQEEYHGVNFRYAEDYSDLSFRGTDGVTLEVTEATTTGWAAVGTHEALPATFGCAVFVGNASPPTLPNGSPHTLGHGVVQCGR